MTVLWLNLFIVFVFTMLARHFAEYRVLSNGFVIPKPNQLLTFIAAASLILVAGLRSGIGDTPYYMTIYEENVFAWKNIDFSGEFGFYIYQMLLKGISANPQILVFVSALITNVLIIRTLYRYSAYFELAAYVYVASGLYLISMNGMRQFLASALMFAATRYILKGSWLKYFLVVLLAATIHKSAIILIPVYFLVRRRAWSWSTVLMFVLVIPFYLGYESLSQLLFTALENTKYGEYKTFQEGGASYTRLLVTAIPVVIAYFGRERLREVWPHYDITVNLSIVNVLITLLATQNWIFARFTIYFGLYQLLLVSWLLHAFLKRDQRIVYLAVLVCYLFFYFYEHVISLRIVYESKFFHL